MKRLLALTCALATVVALAADPPAKKRPRAARWQGVVSHVWDGDTLWVRPAAGGAPRKIRVHGIDAPEICQAHGPQARAALERLVRGRLVEIEVLRTDDYGRPLARLYLGGDDMARKLVEQGDAWSYRYRHNLGPYAQEEALARQQRLGLFAWRGPERPYDFRRRHGACPHR